MTPSALTASSYTGSKPATQKIAVLPISQMESVPRFDTILRYARDAKSRRNFLRIIATTAP